MRNIALLISFLAVLLVAAGCQGGGDGGGPSSADAFIGGTSALNIKFLENAPPSEVTDKKTGGTGFPFKAVVTIENVGEFTIPTNQLNVTLTGFYPADFGKTRNELKKIYSSAFNGVRKDPDGNKIQGDIDQVTFPTSGDLEYQSELAGNQVFPFRAEACYPYQTKALSQLCLQENLQAKDPKVCNPSGSKLVDNSGAPVHVTSVTQSVGGQNKILLHFTVRKVGSSEIFSQPACLTNFESEDRVTVTVKTGLPDLTVADGSKVKSLDCLGLLNKKDTTPNAGELLLDNGQASFTCVQTLTTASKVDSLKTFDIFLDYFAQDSVTTTVLVKHLI